MSEVSVIGLWHLGLVSLAGLADLGHSVVGFDSNQDLISRLRQGRLPLYEPGLDGLLKTHLKTGRLRFAASYESAVSDSEVVLITYDTPVDDQDQVDLGILDKTFDGILPFLRDNALVVVNSQVPVGSTEQWQAKVDEAHPESQIDVVYSPENLRLGQAIELFKKPDMVVVGTGSKRAGPKAEKFFGIFESEKFFVSWRTAEMAKHALNTFFATSISFANEIGNLCDAAGADGLQIAQILKKDSRIGKKAQVRPGLGFAGATLARDLRALENLGKKTGVPTELIASVLSINERQKEHVVEIVESVLRGVGGKVLTVFGLTYKPGTSTLRRSVSIEIINRLHAKGVTVRAHDPKADLKEFTGEIHFEYCSDPYESCKGSSAVLLLTEWPEYKELDYARVKKAMLQPLVIDAKNCLGGIPWEQLGFSYLALGRGQTQGTAVKI